MIYLGLHNSFQAGACLFVDGELIGAVTEERFNRIKNYHGFPHLSIDYLLDEANITLNEVNKVVYGMVDSVTPDKKSLEKIMNIVAEGSSQSPSLKNKYIERVTSEASWNDRHLNELYDWANENELPEDLILIDHHESHAAGAYYTSPFDDALVFTCDGKGNYKSSAVYDANGDDLTLLDFHTTFDSIGYFYGNITKALGYKPESHEGKVTGLAAYGDANNFKHITDRILSFDEESGKINVRMGRYHLPWFTDKLDTPLFYSSVAKFKKEDVAAAAQEAVEDVLSKWVEYSIKKYKGRKTNICLSGGVFANVKLNQVLRELDLVDNVFIQPAMGDMGIPLGSCLVAMKNDGECYNKFEESMALGPEFSNEEIEKYLEDNDINYLWSACVEKDVATMIEHGKVIGFLSGRMEYGPRALCNRSILYHCRDAKINDWLNERLNRTEFMPFAPVTTVELADQCFVDWKPEHACAEFMTMVYNVTDKFKDNCPAAVHVDGTARPQIVTKTNNPIMHEILTEHHKLTGDLALINTSFNNHEEPIVCDIKDAINSLNRNNVDVLVMGDFIVS